MSRVDVVRMRNQLERTRPKDAAMNECPTCTHPACRCAGTGVRTSPALVAEIEGLRADNCRLVEELTGAREFEAKLNGFIAYLQAVVPVDDGGQQR